MANPNIEWKLLEEKHPRPLIAELRRYFEAGGPFEITPAELSSETESSAKDALALLSEIASLGALKHERRSTCFNCRRTLSFQQAAEQNCPYCKELFDDHPPGIETVEVFTYESLPTRDVRWVLTLHGMNTQGEWQEDLNWLVSKTYARMVPVAIYKYGLVRPGAFLRFRHRQLMQGLIRRMKKLTGETKEAGFGSRPDVVAHSLGTLLLGHALQVDSTLNVGRVILTGCVLRPDFDWNKLIERGQVEAVLNHYGTKDFWVKIAHYFIPDTGPSGRRRFSSGLPLLQVPADNFGHSDFFRPDNLSKEFKGLWGSFLTTPLAELYKLDSPKTSGENWKQAMWCFRATIARYFLLTFSIFIFLVLLYFLLSGAVDTWTRFRGSL
jgi:hypothetical protein